MAKGTATNSNKQTAGGPGATDVGDNRPAAGTKPPSTKPGGAGSAAKAGAGKPVAKAAARPAAKIAAKTAAKSAAKPAAAAAPVARVAGELRKKDLVARVAERTGGKKSHVRDVVEAVLEELGAALSDGEGLNLPPLGKAKVNRHKDRGASEVLVVKLRRGSKEGGEGEGLAEAGD